MAIDGESGPMLDLMLPCCESGLIDRRRNHESLDDTESRAGASASRADGESPWRRSPVRLSLSAGTCVVNDRAARDEFGG